MTHDFDIAIVGAGLVGLTAALACASKGASVVLLDRADPAEHLDAEFDGRASAIAGATYNIYKHLGIDSALTGHIQPITDILISDGEAGRAPSPLTLHFDGRDLGGAHMGFMIENRRLRRALVEAAKDHDTITITAPAEITNIERTASAAMIGLACGQDIKAKLLVAADGRGSFCRRNAGIAVDLTPYKQKAIVTTVEHEKPHHGVAHELFLPSGPFAILPLTGNRASIVWSDSSRAVDAAMALGDEAFAAELARRFGNFLGAVKPCAPRWSYPLSLQMAERYTDTRLALIGDAAHAIHPIAGQGLNMGLRDAAALADIVSDNMSAGLDIGGAGLEAFEVWRNFDNRALAGATDIFTRLFSNNIPPFRHARRLGLGLVDRIPAARTFFMKEAAGHMGDLPTLLRP